MSAVDDLTELVDCVDAAERAALASKWKERSAVEALSREVWRALDEQRNLERRSAVAEALTHRRGRQLDAFLDGELDDRGSPARVTAMASAPDDGSGGGARRASPVGLAAPPAGPDASRPPGSAVHSEAAQVGHAQATLMEVDAVAAVTIARLAVQEAHLAVLNARMAQVDAGEAEPEATAVDGHVSLRGRNPVSRHGPALAHGLRGEIEYILTRKPRSVLKTLAVSVAMGLLYLGFLRVFEWDQNQKWLPYLGLWVLSAVLGGSVCLNAMSFDAMRVRAALDSGVRLWHILVIKNLALVSLVAPVGFLLSGLLSWRAGELGAFFNGCALTICFIVLWLGVGNVLSVLLPIRDEPIRNRWRSGTLKRFIIAFVVSNMISNVVNLMLVLRVVAARDLVSRLGDVIIPALLIVLSSVGAWLLLTTFAVALSQQPKIRRALMRELADYNSNAEARAFAPHRQ